MTAPARRVDARALACPSCGGEVTVRSMGHAVNVVCPSCNSVLDARDPGLRVLQGFQQRMADLREEPLIPLGTRGTLHGVVYEAIGFQVRSITAEGERYAWQEYLLFNPYAGFRYLTEYNGHWNDVVTVHAVPEESRGFGGKPQVEYGGDSFRHFQLAEARTDFVLGEFPWQVRAGDGARVSDYVDPPRVLSAEHTPDETTWSLGTYLDGRRVWEAFALPGGPPPVRGVYANQPSPYAARAAGRKGVFGVLLLLLVAVQIASVIGARQEEVLTQTYQFTPPGGEGAAFVTPAFELRGRTSNVALEVDTDVSNSWLYLGLALIDAERGTARDFGREISHYTGRDSDGNWSEGSSHDDVFIPAVPSGRYYLRVAPEGPPEGTGVRYTIRLRRDVPSWGYFFIAVGLITVPVIGSTLMAWSFEHQRWQESDYASTGGGGDDDDDE